MTSNNHQPKDPQDPQETPPQGLPRRPDETLEIPLEPQTSPPPPPRAPLWITISFDPEAGQLFYTTNVKEATTWLGMVEMVKGTFLEKHFQNSRTSLIVPRSKLHLT